MAPTLDTIALTSVLAAFLASLTGSLHCVGMCGPLRLLSGNESNKRLAYQTGRGLGYALLGGAAGAIGWAIPVWVILIVIALGVSLSLLGLQMPARWQRARATIMAFGSASPFLLGLSSGLLPCGMLHAWLAAAAATANPVAGVLLLGALWLGTLPALELSGWALAKPLASVRRRFPRLLPAAFLLIALIPFLLRVQPVGQGGEGQNKAPLQCHHGH